MLIQGCPILSDQLDLHAFTTVLELLVCSCTTLGLCRVSILRYDELVLTQGERRRAVSGPSFGTRAPAAYYDNILCFASFEPPHFDESR